MRSSPVSRFVRSNVGPVSHSSCGQWRVVCSAMIRWFSASRWSTSSVTGRSSSGSIGAQEVQRLAAELVVEHELREAEDEHEVEHPRARDGVHARRAPRAARSRTSRRPPGRRSPSRPRGPCRPVSAGRATSRPGRRRRRGGAPRSQPSASSRRACGTSPGRRRRGPGTGLDQLRDRDPPSTSAVWNTVAPTSVTGAMSPISVTGTISTGIPASTQSIRFWHESSP